jgi:peptidyl-prolyl cis-trans isomerase B (cyclophilin B)
MTKTVDLETSQGTIRLELDEEKAPVTVKNFITNVENGHYDGTVFHRVIKGFMVQGGGFEPGMKQKPTGNPIQNEASNGLKNAKYTVAMARTSDPHSATAQFFINAADNAFLDFKSESGSGWGYAVFGKVVKGSEVIDAIEQVRTGNRGGHGDVPIDDVTIVRATVVS